MAKHLTVAFLVADETDTAEYEPIVRELEKEGATCVFLAPDDASLERIGAARKCPVRTGLDLSTSRRVAFDALVIPGSGVDAFLHHNRAIDLVRKLDERGATIATLGRGVLLLVAADRVDGRHLAVTDDLGKDVEPMGGIVSLAAYLKEGNLITAHGPEQVTTVGDALTCALQDRVKH